MKIERLSEADLRGELPDSDGGGSAADAGVVSKMTLGVKNPDRVNVFVGGKFFCSLDVAQVGELGLKVGQRLDDEGMERLKRASDFGKLYCRALEYVLVRPRSVKEVRDYLKRKTYDRLVRVRDMRSGEYATRRKEGYDEGLVAPVMERLVARGYVDDVRFARAWVEGRNVGKGISRKKLVVELRQKGVDSGVIEEVLGESGRSDAEEIRKMIEKKRGRYDDARLKQYLLRQGFQYGDIVENLK